MYKKLNLIILLGIFLFSICGCGNSDENTNNQNNLNIDETDSLENTPSDDTSNKFNCSAINDLKISLDNSNFLTNNGDIYRLGNYSDGTNCRKFESEVKIEKAIVNTFIGNDNNLYEIQYDDNKIVPDNDYTPKYILSFIKMDNLIKADLFYGIHEENKMFMVALKNDGILYLYTLSPNGTIEKEEEYVKFDNEKIIDFSVGELNSFVIKTDKSYYVKTIINRDECYKYNDIECEYRLQKDEELTKKYSDIVYAYCSDVCTFYFKNGSTNQK